MKTVLVTGATSGFGKGLVQEFLKDGFVVIATGRRLLERHDIFAGERKSFGKRLIEMNLDVTSKPEIEKISSYFQNHPLDILINNAGYAVFGPAEECSEEQARRQFEVNFFGLVFLTQKLMPALRGSRGHIINLSSVLGFTGFPLSSLYCASKFAVEGFSESLAFEMKSFGVRVSLIEPGSYPTHFNQGVEWSLRENESAYRAQVQNYMELRKQRASAPKTQNPNDVIQGILRAAKSSSPKLRYTFGKDALGVLLLRAILPREFFHRLTGRFLNLKLSK